MLINEDLYRTDIPHQAHHILCVIPDSISRAIQVSPTLTALRQFYPDAQISLIGPQECEILYRDTHLIDKYWSLESNDLIHNLKVMSTLLFETFDFFVDLYTPTLEANLNLKPILFINETLKKNLLLKILAKPEYSIGFSIDYEQYPGFIYQKLKQKFRHSVNVPIPKQTDSNPIVFADLTLQLLIDRKKIAIAAPLFPKKIYNPQKFNQKLQTRKNELAKNNVVLFFGGRLESLHWPIHHVIEFCKRLNSTLDVCIHIVGGASEHQYKDALKSELTDELMSGSVVDHIDECTLLETMDIISQSSLLISTLGAPFHIADAYDIPIITIASGSHPQYIYTSRDSKQILLQTPVETEFKPRYLDQILPEQVMEAVHSMIADRYSKVDYE